MTLHKILHRLHLLHLIPLTLAARRVAVQQLPALRVETRVWCRVPNLHFALVVPLTLPQHLAHPAQRAPGGP
eukprot:1351246-Amorphochlora_amoeboformis.AAC.1